MKMADNLNISPEMIDNLVNMLKNSGIDNSNSPNFNNSNNSTNSDNTSSTENSNPLGNMDFETIMKIKTVMDSLNNKNDPDSKLLYSLKPYLRKSRQDKLDQYINILKISQLSKLLKNDKGDAK